MTLRGDGPGSTVTVVGRWDHGLTWMAHPNEEMRRASHALVTDGADVWLVDPLDATGLDETIGELGTVAGVVVLTNSHGRDADRLAEHYGVAIHVPACYEDASSAFDAPVKFIADELGDTGFELVWQKDGRGWKEGALYHTERGTLVVPDALMTSLFAGRDGRLEVFPFFRWSPPRGELGGLSVERVLVGHGDPVLEDAQAQLDAALGRSRWHTPGAIARAVPTFARIVYSEVRG